MGRFRKAGSTQSDEAGGGGTGSGSGLKKLGPRFLWDNERARGRNYMELTLTSAEREFLLEILEEHHRELFREISGTDHREFKSVLKNKEKLLDSVICKLEVAQGEAMLRSA